MPAQLGGQLAVGRRNAHVGSDCTWRVTNLHDHVEIESS